MYLKSTLLLHYYIVNVCECGISYNPPYYKNHLKSKKHIDAHMELSRDSAE